MKTILAGSCVIRVDDEDYARVNMHPWRPLITQNGVTYFQTDLSKGNTVYLHRFILNYTGPLDVDHKNGSTLDNTRENLRICTRSQNHANKGKRLFTVSKFKGVIKDKRNGRWQARIGYGGKTYHIGNFTLEEDAARAYDKRAREVYGEFARLNFSE